VTTGGPPPRRPDRAATPLARRGPVRVIYNHMVVDRLSDDDVDRLFHALADATRRDIVVRAAVDELSVSALARNYAMSITAIQKHVTVLERARLVRKQRRGREQIVTPAPEALAAARDVLDRIEAMWLDRLDRFGEALADLAKGEPT
jgi:DNA-binding transcriptional ArsR family regulator